jgi:hypothetical protein
MRIYLAEGFAGEAVRLTVNGKPVLDLPEARTNYSTGLAASATAEVAGLVTIMVELPGRRLRAEHRTSAREGLVLLVRLGETGPEFEETTSQPRFL